MAAPMSQETIDRLWKLVDGGYLEGKNISTLARELKVSRTHVSRILRTRRRAAHNGQMVEERVREVLEMVESGWSIGEAATKVGVKYGTAWAALRRAQQNQAATSRGDEEKKRRSRTNQWSDEWYAANNEMFVSTMRREHPEREIRETTGPNVVQS